MDRGPGRGGGEGGGGGGGRGRRSDGGVGEERRRQGEVVRGEETWMRTWEVVGEYRGGEGVRT